MVLKVRLNPNSPDFRILPCWLIRQGSIFYNPFAFQYIFSYANILCSLDLHVLYAYNMRKGEKYMARERLDITVTPDTKERLKQYAFEHHTSVSQAITDWIWGQKIKNEQIRGQQRMEIK